MSFYFKSSASWGLLEIFGKRGFLLNSTRGGTYEKIS
jgi:hypothetical protein